MDFPMPDHRWNEIRRSGATAPVAYVCADCGERRPLGRVVILAGELDAERRDELEQAGYEVSESQFGVSGQAFVMDGRRSAVGEDEFEWCARRTQGAAS